MMALTLLVASCVTGSASNCAGWTPPQYEEADLDVISDTLALWLEQHAQHWEDTCR